MTSLWRGVVGLLGILLPTCGLAQEVVRQFDFGTADSPVQKGFVGVHAGTAYDKALGYGWRQHGALKDADKSKANDLERDFCYGYASSGAQAAQFRIDLPDGKYWAAFFAGDIQYSRKETPMDILLGDKKLIEAWGVGGWDCRIAELDVRGGQAELVFQSSQRSGQRYSFWLINAIIIYRGGTQAQALEKALKTAGDIQEAFVLKEYREQAPEPDADAAPISDDDRRRGYVAFARNPLQIVLPSTRPTAQERTAGLRCMGTSGSYLHVTFGVTPLGDLGECSVQAGELRGNAGTIPASAWTSYLARISREKVGGSWSRVFRWQPKVLDPAVKAAIRPEQTRWWWFTVHIPENQAPGAYQGQITFAPAMGPTHVFPVTVEVFPFRLRQPPGEVFGMYWAKRYVRYPDTIRGQFVDLREHGCNGITLDIGPQGGFDADGRLNLDFTEMDEIIKLAVQEGLTSPIPWSGAHGIPSLIKTDLDSEEGRQRYRQVVAAVVAHAKQAGWPPLLFYPVDEPPKEAILRYLPLIKEVPGALTYCTPNNVRVGFQTVQWMDYACWQHQSARGDTREATLKAGKTFWYYSSNYGDSSLQSRMRSGFLRWRLGATGMYYWHYQAPHGDPYNALDGRVTDHCVAYPTPTGQLPSIGWEGQREGIDDYKHARMLEWLIEKAGLTNAHARAAQAVLDRLREAIPPDGKQVLNIPEAFTCETFDKYRAELAAHIAALLQVVGKP